MSFAKGTRSYLIVSTVFGGIVAVIDTAALYLMGIPAPLLWGLLAFLTNYIPNIGFIIGLIPVAILGLLEGGVALMLGGDRGLLRRQRGDPVGHPAQGGRGRRRAVRLADVPVPGLLGVGPGRLGALLAIPLSLLAKALLVDIDPSTRWLNPLLGDRVPKQTRPTPRTRAHLAVVADDEAPATT